MDSRAGGGGGQRRGRLHCGRRCRGGDLLTQFGRRRGQERRLELEGGLDGRGRRTGLAPQCARQGGGQLAGGAEARLTRLGHRPLDHGLAIRREVGLGIEQARHRFGYVLHHHAIRRVGRIRQLAAEHFKDDHAQRVQVAASVNIGLAAHLFRTHVGGCADERTGLRQRHAGLRQLDDAEVRDHRVAVLVEEDIARLQVAVDDALGVRGVEAARHLLDDAQDFAVLQRAVAAQSVGQRAAGHQPHHQVELAVILAVIVNRHDGGMLDHGDGLGLALEACAQAFVQVQVSGQQLDSDLAFEAWIESAIDAGHSAAAQLRADFVTADGGRWHTMTQVRGEGGLSIDENAQRPNVDPIAVSVYEAAGRAGKHERSASNRWRAFGP